VADHGSGGWDLIVTPWHLDEHIPAFPIPANVTETICPALPAGPAPGRMTLLHRAVADAVARAARPLVLSGDCPTALGAVAGLQRRHRDLAVVWLDAHGDFNTPAITISGYLGGMPLAMLTGRAPELFCDALGLRPDHTRGDHPARQSTRHRPGMARPRRPLTVQPGAHLIGRCC
jgi:arginase